MSARSAQGLGDSSRILLLPVELDETAEATVAFTRAHILRPGDVVLILHVVPSYTEQFQPVLGFGGEAVITAVRDVEFEQARCDAAENFVANKLQPMLKDVQGTTVRLATPAFSTDADSVGKIVVDTAKEVDATMVILPSHGQGRFKDLLLGSTSSYLTHNSKVPVLVLR